MLIPLHTFAEAIPCTPLTTKLKTDMRKLWDDHVFYTRNFIISDVDSLGDKQVVLNRLLKNQDDLGNAIKPFYGEKAGNKLASLLREHIVLAGQVVDAAKSGNQQQLQKSNTLWYKNADDIAALMSSVNPYWPKATVKKMLHTHLQFVTEEAVARLHKDYPANVTAFDKGLHHMMEFADIMANGIIKQFPQKFISDKGHS
ncbi:MAG: hypothetical protein ACI35P_15510 [Bacillus sp. (in: firmicutes)]